MTALFTILIPVYNEEDNLLRVEESLASYVSKSSVPACVLFIDDGSSDNSLSMIQEICERQPAFFYISFARNAGLSAALSAGFRHTKTPFVGYIDSDLQTDPEDFELLLPHVKNYALVTGIRTGRKDSFVKNMSSKIANGIRNAFTHDGVVDTGCPLKVFQTPYAQNIPMFKGLHRFFPAMIQLQGGTVKQIPVRHYPRIAGEAKYHLWNRLFGPLMDCFAFLWMKKKYINYTVTSSKSSDNDLV